MKRLLSIENLNHASCAGQYDDTTQSDSSQTGEFTTPVSEVITQTSKRAKKVRARARAQPSATAINSSANTMDTQRIDSVSQCSSPVQSQSRFVDPVGGSDLGNTQHEANMPISDNSLSLAAVMQQLKCQQDIMYKLQGKVNTTLTWIQRIAVFLGIEEQLSNCSGPVDPPLQPAGSGPSASVEAPISVIDSVTGSTGQGDQHPGPSQVREVTAPTEGVQSEKLVNAGTNLRGVILDAIYRDSTEREKRAKSIVISGIKSDGDDDAAVQRLFRVEFDFDPGHFKCLRLGRPHPDHIQPLLVSLQSREDAGWLVANASFLRRSKDAWTKDRIFINQNLTYSQRQEAYERRCRRRAVASSSAIGGSDSVVFRSRRTGGAGESLSRQQDGETVDFQRPITVISNTRRQGLPREDRTATSGPSYYVNYASDFPAIASQQPSDFIRANHRSLHAAQFPVAVGASVSTATTTLTSSSSSTSVIASSSLITQSARDQGSLPSADPADRALELPSQIRSSGSVPDRAVATNSHSPASALSLPSGVISGVISDGVSVSSAISGAGMSSVSAASSSAPHFVLSTQQAREDTSMTGVYARLSCGY